ncbi:mucin-6-like [Branchiostoma lanceolatum]|uniref:mucin-6-like n=1 Tax=Branchiostoma lanceolatum TaxID=7740 RepID=UPI003454BADC
MGPFVSLFLLSVLFSAEVTAQNSNFCEKEVLVEKEVEQEVELPVWKELRYQDCATQRPNDVLLGKETSTVDGKVYCHFNRSTIETVVQLVTVTEPDTITVCCDGYTGDTCEIAICSQGCGNGGSCVGPNTCDCTGTGYTGDTCDTPVCSFDCLNGGSCEKPNVCTCPAGWSGNSCQTAVCSAPCKNGGDCIAPDTCSCPLGWSGLDCSTADFDCGGECLHGGRCIEQNLCQCPEGYEGANCENAICGSPCLNGGQCVAPNKCLCPEEYDGDTCEISLISAVATTPTPLLGSVGSTLQEGSCSFWGDTHYSTFDGHHFYFHGNCSYNLAYECGGLFYIQILNKFECNVDESDCDIAVRIISGPAEITVTPGHHTFYQDQEQTLPAIINAAITAERIGAYTILNFLDGVKVLYDGDESVTVVVPSGQRGSMCGLCGNFDGDHSNDFHSISGKAFDSATEFGNNMHVNDGRKCTPAPTNPPHPCAHLAADEITAIENRCKILYSEAFSACHGTVGPKEFYDSCVVDVCECRLGSINDCSCDALTQYSRMCAQKGVELQWRNENLCPKTCSSGQVYTECGTSCPKTCENADFDLECTEACVDGCHCPKGTLWDGDNCVPREQCPCMLRGQQYPPGTVTQNGCNDCKCERGKWTCGTNICPSTCSVIGESHYTTFDGRQFQFTANCEYVLAQKRPGTAAPFIVWVENSNCALEDEGVCAHSLSVQIGDGAIYRMKNLDRINYNNTDISLPYHGDGVTVRRLSSVLSKFETDIGLEIVWDGGYRIYIKLLPQHAGEVYGLCGTYNYNQQDDFETPNDDTVVNTATFVNSWKTNSDCADVPTGVTMDACTIHPTYKSYAKSVCEQLKADPFLSCSEFVSPRPFISQCESDLCICLARDADPDSCKCTIFAAYARECALGGREIDWRGNNTCPMECSSGQVWQECGPTCSQTCRQISDQEKCTEECAEGCNCPKGESWDEENGQCVPVEECPCYYRGNVYKAGETRRNKCEICTCKNGVFSCAEDKQCDEKSLCTGGKVWSSCVECERSCLNMHVECKPSSCKEGCACPNGTVTEDGKCVSEDQCPCYHEGRSYKTGQTIRKDCNRCRCLGSTWQCTNKKCPAICSAYGDPHYETFDKRHFEFHGSCSYVLAEDFCSDQVGTFKVSVENVPCGTGGVTCTKSVKVTLYDTVIHLIRGSDPAISRNPYAKPNDPPAKYRIQKAGLFLIVKTPYGMSLMWDVGTRVYIKLEPKYMGQVCGLCGNYDGNAMNDFLTRQGELEQRAKNFADSWRVFMTCPAAVDELEHPCDHRPERLQWANHACSVVKSSMFQPCHTVADPEPFFEKCVFDACGCDRGGDCECFCTAVAAYTRECNEKGVAIRWRQNGRCAMQCENGKEYTACGTSCPKTCYNLYASEQCSTSCVEGCHCPNGTVQHNGKCITPVQCPCVYNGKELMPGEAVIANCQRCTCESGKLACTGESCAVETTTTPYAETTAVPTTGVTVSTRPEPEYTSPLPECEFGKTPSPCAPACPKVCHMLQEECVEPEGSCPKVCHMLQEECVEPEGSCPKVCHMLQEECVEPEGCKSECEFGKTPSSCAQACPKVCHMLQEECAEPEGCKSGCVCHQGKVLDSTGNCVDPLDCSCKDDGGVIRRPGESWQKTQCETCTCFDNQISCAMASCAEITCQEGTILASVSDSCCPVCVPLTTQPSTTTPKVCSAEGATYKLCTCTLSCADLRDGRTCQDWESVADGNGKCCGCPEGQVYDDEGRCVDKNMCTCYADGKEYQPNEIMMRGECEQCTCINGALKCAEYCSIQDCAPGKQLVNPEDSCCHCETVPTTVPETTTEPESYHTGTYKPEPEHTTRPEYSTTEPESYHTGTYKPEHTTRPEYSTTEPESYHTGTYKPEPEHTTRPEYSTTEPESYHTGTYKPEPEYTTRPEYSTTEPESYHTGTYKPEPEHTTKPESYHTGTYKPEPEHTTRPEYSSTEPESYHTGTYKPEHTTRPEYGTTKPESETEPYYTGMPEHTTQGVASTTGPQNKLETVPPQTTMETTTRYIDLQYF